MLAYWLMYLALGVPALARSRARSDNFAVWLFAGLLLFWFIGYRHEVGGDWFNYLRNFFLYSKIGSLQDVVDAIAETAGLTDYEISYITQPLTSRELLVKRLNRLLGGILFALNPADHPAKRLYDAVIDTEIEQVLRAEDPVGSYAYCLSCTIQ